MNQLNQAEVIHSFIQLIRGDDNLNNLNFCLFLTQSFIVWFQIVNNSYGSLLRYIHGAFE